MRDILPAILLSFAIVSSCAGGVSEPFSPKGVKYAENLSIEQCNGYITVTIRNPWDTAAVMDRYILVDRDSKEEVLPPRGTVIEVPVSRAVVYSTVHASIAQELGAVDALAGVCEVEYVTSQEVLRRVEDGRIADLGMATSPSVERIMEIEADVIIASPYENSGYGAAEKIGVPIVEAADYMENHPLGRAEWVKFYGILFGCADRADSLFAAVEKRYNQLKQTVSQAGYRPTVLLEKRYGGNWAVPCGGSYIATLHKDAGADYVFSSLEGTNSLTTSFENVFEAACDADFWLFKYDGKDEFSYDGLMAEYKPYGNFKACRERRIYACNTLTTSYYNDITLHPDRILEDFIHIYHPESLGDYQPVYYKPLK